MLIDEILDFDHNHLCMHSWPRWFRRTALCLFPLYLAYRFIIMMIVAFSIIPIALFMEEWNRK